MGRSEHEVEFLCRYHCYTLIVFLGDQHPLLFSSALLAMKGMMVQEGMTMDEALMVMEEGQKLPGRPAPKLPPRVLGGNCYIQPACSHIRLNFCIV